MTYRSVVAVNHAATSSNPIHSDAAAQALGLRGGLVGGMTLFGHLSRPAVERWGEAWMASGGMTARFWAPAYHGDELELRMAEEAEAGVGGWSAELVNADDTVCASAGLDAPGARDVALPTLTGTPTAQQPELLPLIGYNTLHALPDLRPMWFTPSVPAGADAELSDLGPSLGFVDVETLASTSISIMYNTFRAEGPRILTGLTTRQLSTVGYGEPLLVRGRIQKAWRHRERTYATNDVVISAADDTPVMHVQNTTIWELPG